MRPTDGRFSLWPIGVVAFFVVLALVSISPVTRLNAEPPSEFLGLRTGARKSDTVLARQYWANACNVIQWRYRQTEPLPAQTPAEFRPASSDETAAGSEDPAARRAYWEKLREEWLQPDNWHRSYTIDVMWIWRTLQSVWKDVSGMVRSNY